MKPDNHLDISNITNLKDYDTISAYLKNKIGGVVKVNSEQIRELRKVPELHEYCDKRVLQISKKKFFGIIVVPRIIQYSQPRPDNHLKALYAIFIGLLILTILAEWITLEYLKGVL